MKIGVLSDTHGYLDPAILQHFAQCDEVWHAGDIGSVEIIEQLANFKPLRAVYGNIDSHEIRQLSGEDAWFMLEGCTILMTHIGGAPPRYNPRIKKLLQSRVPDIFICGHSHILRVEKDANHRNMLFMNPGAAGKHGFHHVRTILRFDLNQKKIENLQVIELGPRASLNS
jgi:putative phosphoesterase